MNSPFRIGFFSSNFSAAAGNRHAELFHLDCSFAKIVNAFCLRLCLLPGGSPNVDSVAADDHCVRLGVVADCLRHGIFEVFFVERVFDDLLCLLKLYKKYAYGNDDFFVVLVANSSVAFFYPFIKRSKQLQGDKIIFENIEFERFPLIISIWLILNSFPKISEATKSS